jgi:hypothetical protein
LTCGICRCAVCSFWKVKSKFTKSQEELEQTLSKREWHRIRRNKARGDTPLVRGRGYHGMKESRFLY